jgi:ferredoxin
MVITDDCIECGSCLDECPNRAIREGDGKYMVDGALCSECQGCLDICPNGAIVEP